MIIFGIFREKYEIFRTIFPPHITNYYHYYDHNHYQDHYHYYDIEPITQP